jgi:hypothetical protein
LQDSGKSLRNKSSKNQTPKAGSLWLCIFLEKGDLRQLNGRDRRGGTTLNLWLNSEEQGALGGVSRWLSEVTG